MRLLSLSLPDPNPSESSLKIDAPPGIPTGGLGQGETGQKLIQLGIDGFFMIVLILVVVFILIAGIQWIASGGDKQKIQAARGRLVYAIIGLIVTIAAFTLVSAIISLFGGTPSFFLKIP